MTIRQIAEVLGLKPDTVKARLFRRHIKPVRYIGPVGMYSSDVIALVKEDLPQGRPRKPKPDTDT
jgi:hypothetical protein